MTKPDNSISFDDIMDVFSAVEPAPAPEKKAEPEVKVSAVPEPVVEVKKQEQPAETYADPLPEPEAYISSEPAAEAAQPDNETAVPASVAPGAPQAAALFAAYNETSRVIRAALLSFVNEKAVNHMMLGSLEKTALSYPVLKGTNWDKNEKIREDGTIDVDTAERNTLKDQASGIDNACEALSYLTYVRLKAIKTGAGAERFTQVKAALLSGLDSAVAGFSSAAGWYIKNKIIIPAMKRGDESQ